MPQGRVSHYRIIEYLGGTMGKVYLAEDELLRRKVALKFLPSLHSDDDDSSRRFMTEARSASALDHRNICTIHEIGRTEDGEWFIAMSYYEGKTLKHLIADGGLDSGRALDIARQIALGLAAAHEKGIVHRDIKPANVMVTERGRVKILDFGLARLVGHSRQTRTGTVLGTAAYMSPEQANGEVAGHASDIWSLGIVLYEMLADQLPFPGETEVAQIYSIIHKDPAPLPAESCQDPRACARILERCLEKNPERRYASARVLAEDLEVAGAEKAGTRRSRPSRKTISIKPHRLRRAAIAAVVMALMAAAVLGFPVQRDAALRWLGLGDSPVSVAVLPFEIQGEDGLPDPFGPGLSLVVSDRLEDLETHGARLWAIPPEDIRGMGVRTREEAARRLGARFVVSGTGEVRGDDIHLKISLFDPASGTETTRDFRDSYVNLRTWQDEIALWVARTTNPRLPDDLADRPGGGSTTVPRAFLALVRGRGLVDVDRGDPSERDAVLARALTRFSTAVEADSSYACAWVGLGRYHALASPGDSLGTHLAARCFDRALRLAPELLPAHLALARFHFDQGDSAATFARLDRALGLAPDHYRALLLLAAAHARFGNPDRAAEAYLHATETHPRYPMGFQAAGVHHYHRQEEVLAEKYWRTMTDLTPADHYGYNLLGAALFAQGRWEEAREKFLTSLRIEENRAAVENLGTLSYYTSRYLDAIDFYRRSAALMVKAGERPDLDYLTYQSMAESFRWAPGYEDSARVNFARALEILGPVLEDDPHDAELLVNRGSFLVNLDREAEAATIAEGLSTRDDLRADTMFSLAVLFEELGDRESAFLWIENSLAAGWSPKVTEVYPVLRNLRATERYRELMAAQAAE